ncbi:hypothetical protein MF406_06245 [Georgenia sp. TF02-10]|uniref:hypothetical protein n=1 Tax=Georgenia sp. TF02-10 TaxID=2917725 RepID=UPI001FA7E0AC|nr:hypothetical protein [Georgenia sp. TF02-10]UNX55832.1 hypothetical protein MF406_06245 [Georgenia sp. TF02-10]
MTVGVLLALTDAREGELVRALDAPGSGVRVVRRCADVPEVLAAAGAGLGAVAVVSADLPGVDRTVVARLDDAGVRCVLVAAPEDLDRCRALGATAVAASTEDIAALADLVAWLAHEAPPPAGQTAAGPSSAGPTAAGAAGGGPAGAGTTGAGAAGAEPTAAGRGWADRAAANGITGRSGHDPAGPEVWPGNGERHPAARGGTGASATTPAGGTTVDGGTARPDDAGRSAARPDEAVRPGETARPGEAAPTGGWAPAGGTPSAESGQPAGGGPAPPPHAGHRSTTPGTAVVPTGRTAGRPGTRLPAPTGRGSAARRRERLGRSGAAGRSRAAVADPPAAPAPPRPGRLVVVWGPVGAPGRSTVAVTLAAELAALTGGALLVDADTEAPSLTQLLGLLEDTSAIAAVCRQAAHGRLDVATLERLCPVLDGGLRVMTGLTRPDRWRELPAAALDVVWEVARAATGWTVVDVGAAVDDDGPDATLGPRRHQATTAALRAADVVVVVGAGEPVGMRRLVLALGELTDRALLSPGARRVVVANRVRAATAGPRPEQAVHEALVRFAGVPDAVIVPDDRAALDRAVLQGRTLADVDPTSPAYLALAGLAADLAGTGPVRRRGRASWLRRLSAAPRGAAATPAPPGPPPAPPPPPPAPVPSAAAQDRSDRPAS